MEIQERIKHLDKQLLALAIAAAVLSIGGIVTSISPAMDGEAYGYTRIGLGLVGAVGAGMLLFGRDYGRTGLMVIIAWAVVQSVYYATVPDGNYTKQLLDGFLGASSSTTINGEVTDYSGIGLNLVGVAMLAFAYSCRGRLTDWKNRATRGFQV